MYCKCDEICIDACHSILLLLSNLNENVNQLISSENLSYKQEDKARFYENLEKLSDVNEMIERFKKESDKILTNAEITAESIIMDSKEEQ